MHELKTHHLPLKKTNINIKHVQHHERQLKARQYKMGGKGGFSLEFRILLDFIFFL